MRILWLTNAPPYPPISGTLIREYNLIKRISANHEIWLATFVPEDFDYQNLLSLRPFCAEIITVTRKHAGVFSQPFKMINYLVKGIPPELRHYYDTRMAEKIRQLLDQQTFDIFQIDDSFLALYHHVVSDRAKCKKVISVVDIDYLRHDRIAKIEPKLGRKIRLWFHSRLMKRWEIDTLSRFDACLVMSEIDKEILIRQNSKIPAVVIPNGIHASQIEPCANNNFEPNLVFVGNMEYRPNIDAMIYFCNQVLPTLEKRIPSIRLWIVGRNPLAEVVSLQKENVIVTGEVDDVRPYYEKCFICVVPLWAGGGTRLKILEAMAYGRPVVSTSIGCEGIEVVDGENILIANTKEEFVENIIDLCNHESLRDKLSKNGRKLVIDCYDWDSIAQKQIQVYEKGL